ncbi:maleylacetoacetate isomerase [Hephaestia sp. GCM10023244]|uniref:maleylacetoacetate isomerase n=1 Tax=unclassified Hephaestia TaxID=2631281 RepID=UPI002077580D|nr:maleylacetoacetate isomerase [Hephaestia sp. MAHUQ-44]MCM8730498.1 maleylacetoacetate isomerase [Hephaestia sp. MAHUQ-44]
MKLVLHDYWRSSASYRVRIALELKQVDFDLHPVSLLDDAHHSADNLARNPQGFVPTLEVDGMPLVQSLAIIGWLDDAFPDPPLVPRDPVQRAHTMARALVIACDIHPVNNLRIMKRLKSQFGADQAARDDWYRHWMAEGFVALERMAGEGPFLGGAAPDIADICLVPQMYNARRLDLPLDGYPKLVRADEVAQAVPAFAAAHPGRARPA